MQIQGDDVVISSNYKILDFDRAEIEGWILRNLNYRVELPASLNNKEDSSKEFSASFLKRVIHDNLLCSRLTSVYEKLLFGPESIGMKNNRYFYLRRRIRDLCVSTEGDLIILSRYYAFFRLFGKKEKELELLYKSMFKLLMSNKTRPDINLKTVLDYFGVSEAKYNLLCECEYERISRYYNNDVLRVKFNPIYKDY
jgi:hypothetical protein